MPSDYGEKFDLLCQSYTHINDTVPASSASSAPKSQLVTLLQIQWALKIICRVLSITFHQRKRVEPLNQEVCPLCISKTEHFQLLSQLPNISSNSEKFYKTLERKKKQFHSV